MTKCPYCEANNNDFVLLNQTSDYSKIEMALNRQGILRVRYYGDDDELWISQDIVEIHNCPLCGKEFDYK